MLRSTVLKQTAFLPARSVTNVRSASRKSNLGSSFGSTHCISRKIRFSSSPLILAHDEEAEFHLASIRILVLNACDFVPDGRLDPEFFFKFPPQRIARLLAFFDLAPGKLPLQRHGLVTGSLAYQQLAIFAR